MPTTPLHALPFPVGTDKLNETHLRLQELAEAAERELQELAGSTAKRGTQTRAVRTTAQAIPHNTLTVLALESDTFDPADLRAAGFDKIVLNKAGRWLVVGQVSFAAHATGVRRAAILINGVLFANTQVGNAGGTSYTGVPIADVVNVNPAGVGTDYVQLAALQDSGAALNTSPTGSNFLAVAYLGD